MALRKEQTVFIAIAALLAFLGRDLLSDPAGVRGGSDQGEKQYIPPSIPKVDLAVPRGGPRGEFERDLFSPPRDTRPLPKLEMEEPPLAGLAALAPPSAAGPAVRHAGQFLRHELEPTFVDGLFSEEEEFEDLPDPGSSGGPVLSKAQLHESYRKMYDWVRAPNEIYGRIENDDRYRLAERPNETILIVELDPATAQPRWGGTVLEYTRDRVETFAFADTATNRIELRRLEFGDAILPTQLEPALEFAQHCIDVRHEAPRALPVAKEMYELAEAVGEGDARPRLGLARCYEAGFEFEEAFRVYRELAEKIKGINAAAVHVHLADLYARFRLFAKAEEHYNTALSKARTNWLANWHYGRFLIDQGRAGEAIARLEVAQQREPGGLAAKADRSAIRTDLARALMQTGRVEEAANAFGRALQNDSGWQPAIAGRFHARLLLAAPAATTSALASTLSTEGIAGGGFEIALAMGAAATSEGEWELARRELERAVQLDPFRSYLPLRALSWLAERTGHLDMALGFIESAFENNPVDPWTLYQRGRLLAQLDDLAGAVASFQAALDREIDFPEALIALGELARESGEHTGAERYFERALSLAPDRPDVLARRGFNALSLNDAEGAEEAFTAALRLVPRHAAASCGLAWCFYLRGDSQEATTLLGELVEQRRPDVPEDDAYNIFADAQILRIIDHEKKESWVDRFDRPTGNAPANGWERTVGSGLDVLLSDGLVELSGVASSGGQTRLFRELQMGRFVAFEADVTVHPGTNASRVGAFIALERQRSTGTEVRAGLALARDQNGRVGVQMNTGEIDPPWQYLDHAQWPIGQPVRLRLERRGEGSEMVMILYIDDVPLLDPLRAPALGRANSEIKYGVFVDADPGRSARVTVDDVEVIRRGV